MIVYNLRCKNSHEFEGWFRDSAAFDAQAAAKKLVCPVCETRNVGKAIMAPALSGEVGKQKSAPTPGEMRQMRQFVSGLRKHIVENADYVGKDFPEEARKIHYGESEERHIYGEASVHDAQELVEEGIDVAPLPPDMNEAN
ncbi:MAG TPA: DUF1178 family protein [Rhizomicrobium sp.]|nr:DUF1178 family protein [Rhizomicrobium sp.]